MRSHWGYGLSSLLLLTCPAPSAGQGPPAKALVLPVTRDLWVSSVDREAEGNNGGAPRLKLKSYQEMSLVDMDAAVLAGRVVRGATLHIRLAGDQPLRRVTVGSLGAPWVEGRSSGYQPERGSSSFRWMRYPDTPWSPDGGDLCSVMLGRGGTAWMMADASPPDAQGWQTIPVDPRVVALRVAGVSEGFVLFDDTGTEWTRRAETFTLHHMPNRFVYSREQNTASAPYFTVETGPEDHAPPPAPGAIRADPEGLFPGEARVSWTTPGDAGPAGTVGFHVTMDGRPLPRSLVPLAGAAGGRVTLRLRDLKLSPGSDVSLAVRAVDAAGNVGPAASARVRLAAKGPSPLPGEAPALAPTAAPLPRLGDAEVAVVDELDKVHPVTGALIPDQPAGYLARNHLWNASDRTIRLQAARNEFVAFQVVVHAAAGPTRVEENPAPRIEPFWQLDGPPAGRLTVASGRYLPVATRRGPLPDPVVTRPVKLGVSEPESLRA
jgi:hypothetical protein